MVARVCSERLGFGVERGEESKREEIVHYQMVKYICIVNNTHTHTHTHILLNVLTHVRCVI